VLLFESNAVVGNGADTTEDTLYTFTIPAVLMANVGDTIYFVGRTTTAGNTDTKSTRIRFGSALTTNVANTGVGNTFVFFQLWITKTGANTQKFIALAANANNSLVNSTLATSITDTSPIVVNLTAQNATTATANSIQSDMMLVYYYPAN